MRETAILRTLSELDRWKRRRDELAGAPANRGELEKVERQVAYYEALAREMKREVRPSGLSDMLRAFVKP